MENELPKQYATREQIYLEEDVVNHPENAHLNLTAGWTTLSTKCPPTTTRGYYMDIGGNCVFFPAGIMKPDPIFDGVENPTDEDNEEPIIEG